MLGKLEKDGTSLLDELTTQDEDEQTNEKMAKKAAKWKHSHLLLLQTNEDLRPLLGAEYEVHKSTYEDRLMQLDSTRATIESLMLPEEVTSEKPKRRPGDCSSVAQSSRSSSGSAMKAQLFMLKVQESQHAAETKARAAALEEKQKLEMEMKMMESKMQELR
ncbi:hypothetical protein FJT64_025414 [Amphibalanus amphitrite]|uniref:Uncharacterized protein n=1 Tax=Amphibalanus amphitrite TaxID=1232801 RepID=A0A6A4W596_AMPAM|nr:hypothetical protein FJT64_025414 [Amphibalanus amphitrite]